MSINGIAYISGMFMDTQIFPHRRYARADVEMKRKALEKAYPSPAPDNLPSWQKDEVLLTWLKSLNAISLLVMILKIGVLKRTP